RGLPKVLIATKSVINLRKQSVTVPDVGRRMLVVLLGAEVVWLNENVLWKILGESAGIHVEIIEVVVVGRVFLLLGQKQGMREIAIVDLPGDSTFLQTLIHGGLV